MSLYRRGETWWSRLVIKGTVHQFSTGQSNKNKARAVEEIEREKLITGRSTTPTLTEFAPRFLDSLPGRVTEETERYYQCHWKPLVAGASPLKDLPLDKIDAAAIEDFVKWRRKSKLTATTVNHSLRTLRRALHLAEEWSVIVKVPKVRLLVGERQREYVISDADIERFAVMPDLIGRIVPFVADTGLRRSEVIALKWSHVNVDSGYLQITKSKTKAGRRKVPLTKRAVAILKGLQQANPDADYVFEIRGHRLTPDWPSHNFIRARKLLGLPDECVFHGLRHRFATKTAEKGADAFTLQRLCGWSNLQMAMKYVHPSTGKLDEAVARLDK